MLRVLWDFLGHLEQIDGEFGLLSTAPAFEFGQVGETLEDETESVTLVGALQTGEDELLDGADIFLVQARRQSGSKSISQK